MLGSGDFTLGVSGALGGASAVLVIDETPPPAGTIPAAASFARLTTMLAGSGAGRGFASLDAAIPPDSEWLGRVLYARWYVDDPGAPGGVATTALIRFQIFGPHGSGALGVGGAPTLPLLLQLYPSSPNPFVGARSTLRYDLFASSDVRLSVYDAQGRAVRRLIDQRGQLAGAHTVTWDGRDDAGRTLARGVYFYRVETDLGSQSQRVVKLD